MNSAIWVCADGRRINVTDMSIDHLQRSIKLLKSKGACLPEEFVAQARYAASSVTGEYASMAAALELSTMFPSKRLAIMEEVLTNKQHHEGIS